MRRLAPLALVVVATGCASSADKIVVFPKPRGHDACRAQQLGAFAATLGGGGAMVGSLQLRNVGLSTCSLRGRPQLSLLDGAGHPLPVRVLPAKSAAVRLRPQHLSEVHFQWRNWCRLNFPAKVRIELRLPQGGGVLDITADTGRPRCDASKVPSTLLLGTFSPAE
jgi:hypothetical protein